jgi:putative transposase
MMEMTITTKIKINSTLEQQSLFQDTVRAYQNGCNFVSSLVFQTKELAQLKLHKMTYEVLRNKYSLRSQMAQSVMKTVIARYKSVMSNGHDWTKVQFMKPEYDLVWNRDYSLTKKFFSINTLEGRVKVPFETKGMERYFDGSWSFGTAKLVMKHGKLFLHIPITKEVQLVSDQSIQQIVGVDFGINFVAFNGRAIKDKRSHYKNLRKQLQQKQTSSAGRRLKKIGQRENRWQADVNHQVSKALVDRYGTNTLFVIENLSGVRQVTERVRMKDRYQTVSWAFYQLRKMLEYKALLHRSKVVAVDPKYTSQTCPKCGHTERANRIKKKHIFCCETAPINRMMIKSVP